MRVQPNNIIARPTPRRTGSRSVRRAHGYTLLELLLSLAISVLIIGMIGTAIQLYLISLTQLQSKIERKQIARGLVQMISNDLRAGIQYKAADYGDLENLVQTQELALDDGIAELLALEAQATGAAPPETEPIDDEDTEFEPIIDEEAAAFRPSLFGNERSLALDISRLPRMDQYNSIIAGDNPEEQTPSDVKTMAYFFSDANPSNTGGVQFSTVASGGLYRRQVDRAVASHAGDSGLVATPDDNSELIASEVADIRFRYFDGEAWQSEWDSQERGGFPTAIEVILVIDPTRSTSGEDYRYDGFNSAVMEQDRSVVHLPAAELPPEEQE